MKIIQIIATNSVVVDPERKMSVAPHLERARLIALTDDGSLYCMNLPGHGSDASSWRRLPSIPETAKPVKVADDC